MDKLRNLKWRWVAALQARHRNDGRSNLSKQGCIQKTHADACRRFFFNGGWQRRMLAYPCCRYIQVKGNERRGLGWWSNPMKSLCQQQPKTVQAANGIDR